MREFQQYWETCNVEAQSKNRARGKRREEREREVITGAKREDRKNQGRNPRTMLLVVDISPIAGRFSLLSVSLSFVISVSVSLSMAELVYIQKKVAG